MSTKKLRWGIMGNAGIARGSVIPGVQLSELNEVAAIASRNLEQAQQTADKFNIATAYGSYEELLQDETLDIIYIPLPNHLHKPWTIKALEAGKHVLCEKPITLTAAEAEEIAVVSEKTGKLVAEAFMYRYHPRYEQIKQIMASGEIGDVRHIYSSFTFNNAGDSKNVRYKKEWGGGSIYDVGCYPINVARLLLDAEPEAATVHALLSPEHDHVDMMAAGLLEFPNHIALSFDCGMWAAFRNPLEILGTKGKIRVPSAFVTGSPGSGNFFVEADGVEREVVVEHKNAYALQADHLARAVKGESTLSFSIDDAVKNMKVIDACLKSAEERIRVVIQ
ncbi:Gfo/Idh/MocA family protein [Paenibacillus yanchengensis]|uniref:Gfo/Idh/MocA family protein n=1 Tax=Paenibacillus yanchengensis TaxID=2035833 RepID=A0ABW4YNR8_9BACL